MVPRKLQFPKILIISIFFPLLTEMLQDLGTAPDIKNVRWGWGGGITTCSGKAYYSSLKASKQKSKYNLL